LNDERGDIEGGEDNDVVHGFEMTVCPSNNDRPIVSLAMRWNVQIPNGQVQTSGEKGG
jgi:hypothetical protein